MDKATWVGGPKDGQPVTQEDMNAIALAIEAAVLVPDAVQRIHELEAALAALVDEDPLCFEPGDSLGTCLYCERWDRPPGQPVVHDPVCPVVRARALLRKGDNDG